MARRKWVSPFKVASAFYSPDFVAYYNQVHEALLAIGLVQTDQPGQAGAFVTTTPQAGEVLVTLSTSVQNFGFRVYRLNDSLAATSPIEIKLEFVSVYYSSHWMPDLRFTVSKGSVAGVMQHPVAPTDHYYVRSYSTDNVSPGEFPSYAAAGEGYFWLALKVGALRPSTGSYGASFTTAQTLRPSVEPVGIPAIVFGVFREVDDQGTPVAGAFTVVDQGYLTTSSTQGWYWEYGNTYKFQHVGIDDIIRSTLRLSTAIQLDAVPSKEGKVAASRCYCAKSAFEQAPIGGIASVSAYLMAEGDTTDIALFGTTAKPMIFPGRHLAPMEQAQVMYTYGGASPLTPADIYSAYAAPLLAWEGPDV